MSSSLPPAITDNYLPPHTAPAYLRQMIVSALLRKGFESAEAGALAEIERLLEQHITSILSDAQDHAHLSNRRQVNAFDLYASIQQSESESTSASARSSSLRKEGKRKRKWQGLPNHVEMIHPTPEREKAETLSSLIAAGSSLTTDRLQEEDRKPDLARISNPNSKTEKTKTPLPEYVYDGAPPWPDSWTRIPPTKVDQPIESQDLIEAEAHAQPAKVTSALLDFIKLTATERGDIPPELGVVDYRRAITSLDGAEGGGASGVKRRKWGMGGVVRS